MNEKLEFILDLKSALDQDFQIYADLLLSGLYKEASDELKKINYDQLGEIAQFQYNTLFGIIFFKNGDYKTSEEWISKAVPDDLNPENRYLYLLGSIYKAMDWIRSSKINEGINYLNALLPELLSFKCDDLEALIYNWLGNSYWLKGNLKESLIYHKMALTIYKRLNNLEAANSLNNMGIIYRVQGNLKKAITNFNEGLNLNPKNNLNKSFLYSNRSLSYFDRGDFKLALEDQKYALDLRLKAGSTFLSADSLFNIIRIADSLNDNKLLQENFEKLNKFPDYPEIVYLKKMAKNYAHKHKELLKLEHWKEALNFPSLEFGYKLLCYEEILMIEVNQNINQVERILEFIEEFENIAETNNLYPSLVKIRIIKGMIYKNLFELPKAIECLNDAIVVSTDFGLPYHEKLARQELENLNQNIHSFDNFYKSEERENEVNGNDILSYIKNFKIILEEFSN